MSNKDLSISELREKFEMFVFEIDDSLENLLEYVDNLGDSSLQPLDFSWESLDRVELLYSKYLDKEIDSNIDEDTFRTRIARYLGETLRKNMGGVWVLCENPKDYSYGFPEVGEIKNMNPDYAYNPFETLRIYKIKRKDGLIKRALKSHLDYTEDKIK